MTNFLQESIRDGSLVLFHDYRAGHALDLSGNGNHGVVASTCLFDSNGVKFLDTGSEITVTDSPELRLSSGTIIALSMAGFLSQKSNEAILHKRLGTDLNYYFFVNATPAIVLADSASTTSAIIKSAIGYKSLAISFVDGAKPIGYVDGTAIGVLATNVTITPNTQPIEIGNYVNTARLRSQLSAVLLFNRLLTADEHRTAYLELLK